jgi:hypothetical protein
VYLPGGHLTWDITSVEWKNNVLSNAMSTYPLYRVQVYDYPSLAGITPGKDWADFGIAADGNLFNRPIAGTPGNLISMWQADGSEAFYATLTAYRAACAGQDPNSVEITGTDALAADFMLTSAALSATSSAGRALPSDIAALIGQAAGSTHIGCWR